jgi:hypothetical protein
MNYDNPTLPLLSAIGGFADAKNQGEVRGSYRKKGNDMKTKITVSLSVVLFFLAFIDTVSLFATSYPPAPLYHKEDTGEAVRVVGQTVHLFHSGTEEVKRTIHINDILAVFRINTSCEVKMVGKIRLISYIGETYLNGKVVEGEIKPGDIAKQGSVSSLVIATGICDH